LRVAEIVGEARLVAVDDPVLQHFLDRVGSDLYDRREPSCP
jgi:hypothetical protein